MAPESISEFRTALLKSPTGSKRRFPNQFLYAPHSRKCFRRIYCYTHLRYELWVKLECDLNVETFNELPPPVAVSVDQRIIVLRPAFGSRTRDRLLQVHFVDHDLDDTSSDDTTVRTDFSSPEISQALQHWSEQFNCEVIHWSVQSLRANPIHQDNLKELLRYVCVPQRIVPKRIFDALDYALRQVRHATIDHLLRSMSAEDEDWLLTAIASNILGGIFHSDIDRYPFHYATQVSVHHAIE